MTIQEFSEILDGYGMKCQTLHYDEYYWKRYVSNAYVFTLFRESEFLRIDDLTTGQVLFGVSYDEFFEDGYLRSLQLGKILEE